MTATKPKPLYERVKQHILQRIEQGEWQNGARLPSEYDLMATFGASRMTVHRALREMSADGLLHRVQGVGTFVQQQQPRSALLEITDISDDIARRHHSHRASIITLDTLPADVTLARDFSLRRGAKIFYSEIVHYENDLAVQLEERFVTPAFAPLYLQQDFLLQTTSRYLQSIAPATEIEHVIHAVEPDEREQKLLQIGGAEPCLRLVRRTWTKSGPATKSILTHPGSRYSLGSRYAVAEWQGKRAG
jgi:GntR family transcriptional regulator, histidine utilization repressor